MRKASLIFFAKTAITASFVIAVFFILPQSVNAGSIVADFDDALICNPIGNSSYAFVGLETWQLTPIQATQYSDYSQNQITWNEIDGWSYGGYENCVPFNFGSGGGGNEITTEMWTVLNELSRQNMLVVALFLGLNLFGLGYLLIRH